MALKLLQSRIDTNGSQKMVVYFDYSSECDIPVLFENWERFRLMQELDLLIPSMLDLYGKDGGTSAWKTEHEQVYVDTLQDKIEEGKKYMSTNPNWFHVNLQPEVSTEMSRSESSSFSAEILLSPQQSLAPVTVEHTRPRRDSDIERNDPDHSDNLDIQHHKPSVQPTKPSHRQPSLRHLNPLYTPGVLDDCSGLQSPNSSSLEDLEHDIHFILYPSVPGSSKVHRPEPSPIVADILPLSLDLPPLLPALGQSGTPCDETSAL